MPPKLPFRKTKKGKVLKAPTPPSSSSEAEDAGNASEPEPMPEGVHDGFDPSPIFAIMPIVQEKAITKSKFENDDQCTFSLEFLESCGHSRILQPARKFYYPRLVHFFCENVKVYKQGFSLEHNGHQYIFTEQTIAMAGGYTRIRPSSCSAGPPTHYVEARQTPDEVHRIADIISASDIYNNNAISRNDFRHQELIFLDYIISVAMLPIRHERHRRSEFLHVLYDLHHRRWFSIIALFLASLRAAVATVHKRSNTPRPLHYPHLISALLVVVDFSIPEGEPKIEGYFYFSQRSWC